MGVGPHSSGDLADRNFVQRRLEPIQISSQLERPSRQFEAEGGRLCPDSVSPPDHVGVPMFERQPFDDIEQIGQCRYEKNCGITEDHTSGRVEYIRGGQSVVDPGRSLTSGPVGENVYECRQIVIGQGLSFGYFGWAGAIGIANCGGYPRWSGAKVFPSLQSESLHLLPRLQLSLLGPHGGHLG